MLQWLRKDIIKYNNEIKHKDLVYLIGLFLIIIIGLLKELVYFMENRKYSQYKVSPATIEFISNLEEDNLQPIHEKETLTAYGIADYYRNVGKTSTQIYKKDISSPAIFLRNYLITNNFTLQGNILKTKFPRVPEDKLLDFCRGTYDKPYMVQYITFGKNIDLAISKLFDYKLTNSRKFNSTYLTLSDSELLQLEEDFKNVFMITDLKVKLIDKEVKKV